MKKYIYGTVLVAMIATAWIFLANPPAVTDHAASTILSITFRFPAGFQFTEGAPFSLTWQAESPAGELSVPMKVRNFDPLVSPYHLSVTPPGASAAVVLKARLYYCDKTTHMCFQHDYETRVPLIPGRVAVPWVWDITPKKA